MFTHLFGARLTVWLCMIQWLALSARAEIVYDNTSGYLTNYFANNREFGDEVKLSGNARLITDFQFEYFGDFNPTGNEKARLRFYANDGIDTDPRPDKVIRAPGTLLYDSGLLPIMPGFNAVSVAGLSVNVPDVFTWTVQFNGVDGNTGNKAGLVFFNPPSVGFSFDDFWQNMGDNNWVLFRLFGNPVANFGSRIATPDSPLSVSAPERLADGSMLLNISGPTGRAFTLEFSTNALHWVALDNLTLNGKPIEFIHAEAANFLDHFYRATVLPETPAELVSINRIKDGRTQVQFFGPLGKTFRLQASFDFQNWLPIKEGVFPAGIAEFIEPALPLNSRFYRLEVTPPPAQILSVNSIVNNYFVIGIAGPPGQRTVIQASSDLFNWSSISTNTFSFASGGITFVDFQSQPHEVRFYRAISLP